MQLSQVLSDEFLVLAASINFGLEAVKGSPQSGIARWVGGHDLGEFWAEQPRIGAREEQSNAQADGSNFIAVALGDAVDEAMQAEAA